MRHYQSFLDMLRDPIWQFVGALLALLAIIVPFVIKGSDVQELTATRWINSNFGVLSDVGQSISIMVNGESVQGNRLSVVYYLISNDSDRPIRSQQFVSPILLKPRTQGAKLVALSFPGLEPPWTSNVDKEKGVATFTPPLLNPRRSIFALAYVLTPEGQTIQSEKPLDWVVQAENVELKYFDSPDTMPHGFLDVEIKYSGMTILLLLTISLLIMLASIGLGRLGGRLHGRSGREVAILIVAAAMSFTTGEIISHAITRSDAQPKVATVLLVIEAAFVVYLLWPKLRATVARL